MIAAVGRSCPTRMQACQKDLPLNRNRAKPLAANMARMRARLVEPTEMMMELRK